jgi:hypothetical protein
MIDRHVLILRLADLDRRAEWDGHILLVETTAAGARAPSSATARCGPV